MKLQWKNFWLNGCNRQSGFSLLEVLFAIAIFTVFLSSYMINQGQNLDDSRRLQEDLILRRLAEDVINQIILDTPKLSSALTLAPETKRFEGEYEDFEYTVEYRKLEIPNLQELNAKEGEEDGQDISAASVPSSRNANIQQRVFQEVKNNIEKILWQISITVKNRTSENSYIISTWIRNPGAKVRVSL